jgi:hypothetical protein
MKKLEIPKEYVWDYKKPIDDLMWKLQRIAMFFPSIGTDKETIDLLYEKRDELKMEEGKYILIGLYKEIWDEKIKKNKRK